MRFIQSGARKTASEWRTSQISFAELKTKGLFANSGTVEGKTVKNIVKGYTVETDFVEYEGQEPLPFD